MSVHALNQSRIHMCAGAQTPYLRFRVKLDQAEAKMPCFIPLEVVGKRPMEVATQIGAFRKQRLQLLHTGLEHPWTNTVSAVRHAIFEDVERLVEVHEMLDRVTQTLGISLAVEHIDSSVALRFVWRHRKLD